MCRQIVWAPLGTANFHLGLLLLLLLLLWRYSNSSPSLCFHPLFEHLNPAPAGIDTQCHGTSLSQLWREEGLSSDIAGGVETVLVTPPPLLTTLCVCVWVCVPWSLFDITALCSFPIVANTMDIVSTVTKRCSFFGPLKPAFHHHPWMAWWRLWPLDKEGWTRFSESRAVRCWHKQRSFSHTGWSQRREAYFTVAIPCRKLCTTLVGTGIFLIAEYRIRSSKCFRSGSLGFAKP